jgi:hypothetical protein
VNCLTIKKRKWNGQHEKYDRKTKDLLMETEGSAEATLQAKLGPVVDALLSLLVRTMEIPCYQ